MAADRLCLRWLDSQDAPLLAAVHAQLFQPPWQSTAFVSLLAQPGVYGLLACRKGAPAGFIILQRAYDQADVLTLAITPAMQRQRIGLHVVRVACRMGRLCGVKTVFLEVSASNHPAIACYGKAGFVRAATRPAYYADGSDALVLRWDRG